jgi:hypothetical protein
MDRADWPIIVGGCYRSGTSLVRRILNAHSRIYCGPEVKFFRDFYGNYFSDPIRHLRFTSSARALLPESELLAILGRAFIAVHQRAAALQGKARWADKNPENPLYLKEWQMLLGDGWLFVHVVREPRDTLASIKEVGFPLSLPADLASRIELYLNYHRPALEFGLRHPDRYIRIRYEALVADPQGQIDGLMTRLGESAEPRQLEFNSVEHQVGLEDPKIGRTRGIDASRVGQWRAILTAAEADQIRSATAALWAALATET